MDGKKLTLTYLTNFLINNQSAPQAKQPVVNNQSQYRPNIYKPYNPDVEENHSRSFLSKSDGSAPSSIARVHQRPESEKIVSKPAPAVVKDNLNLASHFPSRIRVMFSGYEQIVSLYKIMQNETINNTEHNVSLYSGILFVLYDDFVTMSETEQIQLIHDLKTSLILGINRDRNFINFNYGSLNFTKVDLLTNIKNNVFGDDVLRYLSDFFEINIFIFDFEEQNVYTIYPEKMFVKYKKNIFLARSNGYYTPIIHRNESYWTSNMKCFEDFINNNADNFTVVSCSDREKQFILADTNLEIDTATEDLEEVFHMNDIKKENKEDDEPAVESELTETKPNTRIIVNCKMKMKKLQEVAESVGVPLKNGKKNKLKAELLKDLKVKLNLT